MCILCSATTQQGVCQHSRHVKRIIMLQTITVHAGKTNIEWTHIEWALYWMYFKVQWSASSVTHFLEMSLFQRRSQTIMWSSNNKNPLCHVTSQFWHFIMFVEIVVVLGVHAMWLLITRRLQCLRLTHLPNNPAPQGGLSSFPGCHVEWEGVKHSSLFHTSCEMHVKVM